MKTKHYTSETFPEGPLEADGDDVYVYVLPGAEDRKYVLRGSEDGSITVLGPGRGDAVRKGHGGGDAIRIGEGGGGALRKGAGEGEAIRDGTGDGCARRKGEGCGDAHNTTSGTGDAVREGPGSGDAVRFGSGTGHAVRVGGGGNARRGGAGYGEEEDVFGTRQSYHLDEGSALSNLGTNVALGDGHMRVDFEVRPLKDWATGDSDEPDTALSEEIYALARKLLEDGVASAESAR